MGAAIIYFVRRETTRCEEKIENIHQRCHHVEKALIRPPYLETQQAFEREMETVQYDEKDMNLLNRYFSQEPQHEPPPPIAPLSLSIVEEEDDEKEDEKKEEEEVVAETSEETMLEQAKKEYKRLKKKKL